MTVTRAPHSDQAGTSAARLAEIMRHGLEAKPKPHAGRGPVAPATMLPGINPAARGYATVLNHPPVAQPGLLAPFVRLLRRCFKVVMRPWLEVQTRFNQIVLNAANNSHTKINEIISRSGELEGRTHNLETQLAESQRKLDLHEQKLLSFYDQVANREQSHEGKIAQGGMWFNPPINIHLRDGKPVLGSISERILEHIFVHTRLPRPPARVLDLGCAESTNAIEMASLGYEVVGMDLRELKIKHPSFRMVVGDIANIPFPDGHFDVVVSLSTIEHVGLDWYAKSPEGSCDRKVVAEAQRVLRPGGRFILTMPFGRSAITPVHRVYDCQALEALLRSCHRVETLCGIRDGDCWSISTDLARAEQLDSTKRVSAVALVVVEKS